MLSLRLVGQDIGPQRWKPPSERAAKRAGRLQVRLSKSGRLNCVRCKSRPRARRPLDAASAECCPRSCLRVLSLTDARTSFSPAPTSPFRVLTSRLGGLCERGSRETLRCCGAVEKHPANCSLPCQHASSGATSKRAQPGSFHDAQHDVIELKAGLQSGSTTPLCRKASTFSSIVLPSMLCAEERGPVSSDHDADLPHN